MMIKTGKIGSLISKFFLTLFLAGFFLGTSLSDVEANQDQFITVVNPVRISQYTENPEKSISSQYEIVKRNGLPATWLLTYDAIENVGIKKVALGMDKKQELGIFLEVTAKFATDAGVVYHDTGFWHHANSVFLSGYTQEERIKLISTVFEKFKSIFDYYPTSVGSWWTDAYSLSYMNQKYGISANLTVADQLETDGYTVWGQYWSTPYYPSKYHTGVPASDLNVKVDVVNFQWAARDPLNGYASSLYSTQDYSLTKEGLDIGYFEKLVNLYAKKNGNQFGQITVGLEGDVTPDAYGQEFAKQMKFVKNLVASGDFSAISMRDFSEWYKEKFKGLSPEHKITTKDFLGTGREVVWIQGPNGRVGYIDEKIIDKRVYSKNLIDPYYYSPNGETKLWVQIPEEETEIPPEGVFIKDYSVEATHFFRQRRFVWDLIRGHGWEHFKKQDYQIPQGEIYGLLYLARQPRGRVLVYDNECLQCSWHTKYKHPALANRRSYVEKYGNHSIVYNSSVFEATKRADAKKELIKTRAKYIYLVKFEDYIEKLPFSPGDYGVEKIYENANAQIWRVK